MKHFTLDEFKCKHCGEVHMNPVFLDLIDKVRDKAGIPFVIESGYRCPVHEKEVGGTGANHPFGEAADIVCKDGPSRLAIVAAALSTGFHRLGIAKTFIHLDISDQTRGLPKSIWLY